MDTDEEWRTAVSPSKGPASSEQTVRNLREDLFFGPLLPDEMERIGTLLATMDPWRALGYTPEGLARYLSREDPALSAHVVRGENGLAAVVCVREPWLMGPFIELLACFDPFRGIGLGREILACLESRLKPGTANLWTTASSFNAQALGFYRHMGFTEVAQLKDLVRQGYDEILLRKRLADS
jgi:GNAT superfamily N-acetyltransferase